KRDEERIRRNKPDMELTTIHANGPVPQPELRFEDPHPVVQDMWNSLAESGQAVFYEPSDWQYARFTLHFADKLLRSARPSSQMPAAATAALTDLLVSDGPRRRGRMEVERNTSEADVVDLSEMFKERMGASSSYIKEPAPP